MIDTKLPGNILLSVNNIWKRGEGSSNIKQETKQLTSMNYLHSFYCYAAFASIPCNRKVQLFVRHITNFITIRFQTAHSFYYLVSPFIHFINSISYEYVFPRIVYLEGCCNAICLM